MHGCVRMVSTYLVVGGTAVPHLVLHDLATLLGTELMTWGQLLDRSCHGSVSEESD